MEFRIEATMQGTQIKKYLLIFNDTISEGVTNLTIQKLEYNNKDRRFDIVDSISDLKIISNEVKRLAKAI